MYPVDRILSGERFRDILRDTTLGSFEKLEDFIADFHFYAGEDYSDPFLYKMMTMCRYLIDLGLYDYVDKILEDDYTLGLYESEGYEGEECILTYAIRKINEEKILEGFLKHYKTGCYTKYCYQFDNPAIVAAHKKKYRVLKLLYDKELCDERKTWFGRWTLLQYAVVLRNYELAEFTLDVLKHNPDYYDMVKVTPAMLANRMDDPKMHRILCSRGACP